MTEHKQKSAYKRLEIHDIKDIDDLKRIKK